MITTPVKEKLGILEVIEGEEDSLGRRAEWILGKATAIRGIFHSSSRETLRDTQAVLREGAQRVELLFASFSLRFVTGPHLP